MYSCSGPGLTLSADSVFVLDGGGNPASVFVLVTPGYLHVSPNAVVVLRNGARASNGAYGLPHLMMRFAHAHTHTHLHAPVFWALGADAALDSNSTTSGIIVAMAAVTLEQGATLQGAALSLNAAVTRA